MLSSLSLTPRQNLLPDNWGACSLSSIARLAPLQPLQWSLAKRYGVEITVKREDLLHHALGGNKFYKMYGHLKNMKAQGFESILTFGGAYSNHIYAVSAAGRSLGISTIGVIRGERPKVLSPTLVDAEACGMELRFVSREDYRKKQSVEFISALQDDIGPFYCVPEGGGDAVGAQGCYIWARETLGQISYKPSHIAVACGTGATAAGIYSAAKGQSVLGFLALKGTGVQAAVFKDDILALAEALRSENATVCSRHDSLSLETDYHCGGYAKFPEYLRVFTSEFTDETSVPLDRVYMSKLFWGLKCQMEKQLIPCGSHVLVFHSGGLQGNR